MARRHSILKFILAMQLGTCDATAGSILETTVHTLASVANDVEKGHAVLLEPELMKGINLPATVRGLGRLWRISPCDLDLKAREGLYSLSKQVEEEEYFLSHTWQTPGWKKVLTLTFRFGFLPGWLMLSIVMMCVLILYIANVLPMLGLYDYIKIDWSQGYLQNETVQIPIAPWFMVTLTPSFWLGLALWPYLKCLWGKEKNCFLDVTCIDQVNKDRMIKGIYGLGHFLKKSKNLLILWSSPQFYRKWCVYEIAAYFRLNPEGLVFMFPLFMEQVAVAVQILISTGQMMSFGPELTTDEGVKQVVQMLLFLASWLPMLFGGHYIRMRMREKIQLKEVLANFDVHKAGCREQADAEYIHKAITTWYGSEKAFNQYVRTDFRSQVMSKMTLGAKHWPYKYLLFMIIPYWSRCLDIFMALAKDGTSATTVYIGFIVAQLSAGLWGGPCTFQVCIGSTEYFAMTGSSSKWLDYLFSFGLYTLQSFFTFLIFGIGPALWLHGLGPALFYAVVVGAGALRLYCCDRCQKEETQSRRPSLEVPSDEADNEASVCVVTSDKASKEPKVVSDEAGNEANDNLPSDKACGA